MELVRTAMGLPPGGYRTDPRLIEVHFGDWQGHTFAELESMSPGATAARALDKWHFVPPGEHGESYEMLPARTIPWFDELRGRPSASPMAAFFACCSGWLGAKPQKEAAALDVAQDRVLRFERWKAGVAVTGSKRSEFYSDRSMSVMRFSPPTSS